MKAFRLAVVVAAIAVFMPGVYGQSLQLVNPGLIKAQADRTVTGTITSTQTVPAASGTNTIGVPSGSPTSYAINTQGEATLILEVSGSFTTSGSGLLIKLVEPDGSTLSGTTIYPILASGVLAPGTAVSAVTGDGLWAIPCGGVMGAEVVGSSVASGTATVTMEAGPGSMLTYILNSISVTMASVGATGSAVPGSADYMAGKNGSGNLQGWAVDSSGNGAVNIENSPTVVLGAGSAVAGNVGQSGSWTVQPGNTANTTPWLQTISQGGNSMVVKAASTAAAAADPAGVVSLSPNSPLPAGTNQLGTTTPSPATSGGTSFVRIYSAASTNATNVKSSPGQLYSFYLFNNGATAAWVHMYNSASAPTAGAGTIAEPIGIPAGGSVAWSSSGGMGEAYSAGIGYTVTGAYSDTDTTAVTAGQVTGKLEYK